MFSPRRGDAYTAALAAGGVVALALAVLLLASASIRTAHAAEPPAQARPLQQSPSYAAWTNGLNDDADYFPIAVWLQNPSNAARYREIGINLYVGLWKGPTEPQLEALTKAGMPVICHQDQVGLASPNADIIVGWMHGDEPDNAQSLGQGKGYGPPIEPSVIQAQYEKIRTADPTRPVLLNLGQGVAWDGWIGRGVRTNHPEDYAEYARGGDIVSFDIYPAVATRKEVAGQLWRVPFGVDRLRQWTDDRKIIWNCIETTHINNPDVKPTPQQVKAEVWMSIIHGSRGIIYFAHQFKPRFIEAGLLADAGMTAAVRDINRQVTELAPVINSPDLPDAVTVASSNAAVPVWTAVKRHKGQLYLFAVAGADAATTATFTLPNATGPVAALGEDRDLTLENGAWSDDFAPYAVHLYRLGDRRN